MFEELIKFIVNTVGEWGYTGIFFLMLLESTFFPFPSEVVMVPAGYLAFKGEMNLYGIIAAGTLGSLAGALLNYGLAFYFGRAFLLNYGHYMLMKKERFERMEAYFKRHGAFSTFAGRLIPAVRQYISLPAGLSKMNIVTFSLYTSLGAGIWVTILALLGYFIGENEILLKEYLRLIILVILVLLIIAGIIYYRINKKNV